MTEDLFDNYVSCKTFWFHELLNKFYGKRRKNPTIAFIHGDSNVIAGSELALLDMILEMKHTMFNLVVITRREGPYTELLKKHGIRFKIIKLSRFDRFNPFPFIRTVLSLAFFFIKNNICIAHVNNMLPHQYTLIAARAAGIPCICHIRSTIYTPYDLRSSLVLHADKVAVVTEGVKQAMMKLGVAENNISVTFDGININQQINNFSIHGSFRSESGIRNSVPLVGQFGQIIERKGVACFLDMAKIVHERMKNVRFVLVGSQMYDNGTYYNKMLEYCKAIGMSDKVIFTGFRADARKIVQEVDIHVLASTAEGGALVLMESAAAGKPVVASDIPGTNDQVIDGVTGFLVPERNPQEFAEKVIRLIKNRGLAQTLGKNARAMATERFSIEKNVHKMVSLYSQLLEGLTGCANASQTAYSVFNQN